MMGSKDGRAAFDRGMRDWVLVAVTVAMGISACARGQPAERATPQPPARSMPSSSAPVKPADSAPPGGSADPCGQSTSGDCDFSEQGCARRFPSEGTSWVEKVSLTTRLHDANGIPSMMISAQNESEEAATHYRVLRASAGAVTSLRVASVPGAAPPDAQPRTLEVSSTGTLTDALSALGARSAVRVSEDRLHVENGGLVHLLNKGRSGWIENQRIVDVERALQPLLVEVVGSNDTAIEARYLGSRNRDGVAVEAFSLRAKGEQGSAAACHGRSDKRDLHGEMLVRGGDLVLLSIELQGRDDIVEDTCAPDGATGRVVVGRHVADTEFRLAATCFATALAP